MEEIEKAYGQYWNQVKDHVDANGYVTIYQKDWGDLTPKIDKNNIQHGPGLWWRIGTLRHLPAMPIALSKVKL
jgi:hypothetical protein